MAAFPELWTQLPRRARVSILWLAAAATFLAFRTVSGQALLDGHDDLVWPGLGVAFVVGLEGGPWLATAPATAVFGYSLATGRGFGLAASVAVAVLAASLVASRAYLGAGPADARERVTDFVRRATAAIVAALVAATCFHVGVAAAGADLTDGPPHGFGYLFVNNLAAILVVAPFLRSWLRPPWPGVAGRVEKALLVVIAALLTIVVNEGLLGNFGPTPYLLLCVVFWAALRTGRRGTSTVLVVVAVISVAYASHDRGAFLGATRDATAMSASAFLVVLALAGLGFASLAAANAAADRRYRDLVERLPLVTYVNGATPDDPAVYISPQIETLLGYQRSEWYADPDFVYRVIHDGDRPLLDEVMQGDDDLRQGEYRMVAADGRVVWVLDHMITLRDEAGERVGDQGFLIDITRQKQLEEQLRQAQRIEALGLLAGGVAHDFNNLLMAISGYTELALAHADDPERCRADLREVSATSARAAELTRQLLAFARRQALEREIVDLNAVVREAEPLLTRLLGADVALVLQLDEELGAVRGDSGQLTQVLLNLAVNARDAMPAGGTLTIASRNERLPSGDVAVLIVSDTGHGIDAETQEHIFEPFFTTKEVGRGTGLGLPMVYGIVEQLEGHIAVESSPGEGATFRISLPRVARQPEPPVALPPADALGGSETVLLVEDEDVVRRLAAEMLERLGYDVVAFASPYEALDYAGPWDVLLTDVLMPGMRGPELATELLHRRPDTGVVFMSGYAGSVADDALAGHLLTKPFELAELARAVRRALDERSATAAA